MMIYSVPPHIVDPARRLGFDFDVAAVVRLSLATVDYGSFVHTRLRGTGAAANTAIVSGMPDLGFPDAPGAESEFEYWEKLSRV
jgi:hypothetical protein